MSNNEFPTKITPVGDIAFLALRNTVKATEKKGNNYVDKLDGEGNQIRHYVCSLVIDGNTTEGKSLRQSVLAINDKLTSDKGLEPGFFKIQAKTRYDNVVVGDLEGNELTGDGIPYFNGKTDSGKASMKIALDADRGMLHLKAVLIDTNSLHLEPREEISEEEKELRIKAARRAVVEEMAALNGGNG